MNLVCSWGGVGTTFFLEYLQSLDQYECNPPHGYLNPLKHPLAPPPKATRAVFLYGCPYLSFLSLFRRDYDALHYVNINQLFPPEQAFPQGNLWHLTCERFQLREKEPGTWVTKEGQFADRCGALDWLKNQKEARLRALDCIEELAREAYRDLDHYLDQGQDLFRRKEQWDNWKSGASYPVLLVKYETLWQHRDRVLDFLRVPQSRWSDFPPRKNRETRTDRLSPSNKEKLQKLYSKLADEVESMQAIQLLDS